MLAELIISGRCCEEGTRLLRGSMSSDWLITSPHRDPDVLSEPSLHPQRLTDYVGQEQLKLNLSVAIDAAKARGEPLDHILLYSPPGVGKRSMANVIAHEMGVNI